jgi:xanthine/CO dehydrogenase XdhC/CoxF family maturation factor
MKELQDILARIETLAQNEKAILATVVDVQGSSYRLPGAKMLIVENGETFGTVSGGCLEADVLERAAQVLRTGAAQILTYDTTANDDSVFSLNMGCRGIVRILLEPVQNNQYFDFVKNCFETRQIGVAATLIRTSVETNLKAGARLFINETAIWGNDFEAELSEQLAAAAHEALQNERSFCETYRTNNVTAEFFVEIIKPPTNLTVFGAGADAVPLVEAAKNLGWRVSLVDHRPAFATTERFPTADRILISRYDNLEIEANAVGIIMTHNYEHDRRILKTLLKSETRYVGILGPKRRTENLLQELADAGEVFSENDLNKLYAPVGLDIGADTPESIAVSIVAEIQAALSNRAGGFLKNRQGSIYNRK